MKFSLKTKLTYSYILIVLLVVGLMIVASNITIKSKFQNYVMERQEKQTHEIVESLTMNYSRSGWEIESLDVIGMNALQKGLIIEIYDSSNNKIWSAYEHNNGLCHAIISNMWANMYRYSEKWKGEYEEKEYSLLYGGNDIGTLVTGYVGPYYFTDEELGFITALNKMIVIIGISSITIAIGLGFIMSSKISKPLRKIADWTSFLTIGNYSEKVIDKSSTKEIIMLTEAIERLSNALEYKETLQKQLTQDVAHELRTPLTSIQGNLEAMIDGIWEMDKNRLISCNEELERIKRMIGSIEALSKVENDNVLLHMEEFDLLEHIEQIGKQYENELQIKKITIDFISNYDRIAFIGDKDKIAQVFHNLISNGIRYSVPNGVITIHVSSIEGSIVIKIKDTGIGIEEKDLPYIFERFYRVDKSRSKDTGGMGIGLTITKSIVEAHNGSIEVKSQKNVGTEFILEFKKNG